MDETTKNWYLMKYEDGTVFGPIPFKQLKEWADSAQISPHDKISRDQQNWAKAPTYPELKMDWLVRSSSDYIYGPTTIGALNEFLKEGEITLESEVINCVNGREGVVSDVLDGDELILGEEDEPGRTRIRENLQKRIKELESQLKEERGAVDELRRKFEEISSKVDQQK